MNPSRDSTRDSVPLEAILECAICLERFSDPRVLPCQHTLCLSCLDTVINAASTESFQCPTCRRDYRIPQNGAGDFPKNLLAISLIDSMTSSTTCVMNTSQSDVGLPNLVTSSSNETFDETLWECKHHPKHAVKYFCKTCEIATCSECCLDHHHGHSICRLGTVATNLRTRLEESLISRARSMVKLSKMKSNLERRKSEIEHQVCLVKTEVAITTETICTNARKQETELLDKINQMGRVALDKIAKSMTDCENQMASTERLCTTAESLNSDKEMVVDGPRMTRALDGMAKHSVTDVTCNVLVHKTSQGTISVNNLVGQAEMKTHKSLVPSSSSDTISETASIESQLAGRFWLGSKTSVTGMVVVNEHLYITHARDTNLWVYTTDGAQVARVSMPKLLSPSGLAVLGCNQRVRLFVVTDTATVRLSPKPPCRLHLLKLAEGYIIASHDIRKLDYVPRKVTISCGDDIVIASERKCVIHHSNGDVKQVVYYPEGLGPSIHSFRDHRVQCVVLESSKITWLNSLGQIQNTCTNEQLMRIVHASEDTSGQLLVVTQGKRKLHLVSEDGHYMGCLLEEPCDVDKSHCIFVDDIKQQLYIAHQSKSRQAINRYEYRRPTRQGDESAERTHFSIDIYLSEIQL